MLVKYKYLKDKIQVITEFIRPNLDCIDLMTRICNMPEGIMQVFFNIFFRFTTKLLIRLVKNGNDKTKKKYFSSLN